LIREASGGKEVGTINNGREEWGIGLIPWYSRIITHYPEKHEIIKKIFFLLGK